MSLQNVEAWHRNVPRLERGQSLIVYGGVAYSPDRVLAEVRAGTVLGGELQAIIERRAFSIAEDKYALAILRLRERLSRLPEDFGMAVANGGVYTPSQLLQEIDRGSKVARNLIEAEIRRLEEVSAKW